MTPKEKAKNIYEKFYIINAPFHKTLIGLNDCTKACSLYCVSQIIEKHIDDWDSVSDFWKQVKHEINILK